ncbi:uncharacterized protein LOC133906207 [Phragmites australis]|uniref:uncharacterized protein LOC133906207 n=1 Tax=Phragmites australis TaxID=29695 RepID=UPI002D78F344|nr:uncharacterized protein LOC133906207 [Phragmites australis]
MILVMKRKKKQRLEAATQTQKDPLDRFVVKESQFTFENQIPDGNVDEGHGDDDNNTVEVEVCTTEIDHGDDANNTDEVSGHADGLHASLDGSPNTGSNNDINNSFQHNIVDPRYWDAFDPKIVDILVQKGPKSDLYIQKDPKDRFSRRFSAISYT